LIRIEYLNGKGATMLKVRQTKTYQMMVWLAVSLALPTSVAYVLIAQGILGVGDLQTQNAPSGIVYAAAGCYLLGGLLIPLRRRWLWIFGVFMNTLVVLAFFNMYKARPLVMFSAGGLLTKIPQILLEAALLYLIIADWLGSRPKSN
jgi:hypothetical protein